MEADKRPYSVTLFGSMHVKVKDTLAIKGAKHVMYRCQILFDYVYFKVLVKKIRKNVEMVKCTVMVLDWQFCLIKTAFGILT